MLSSAKTSSILATRLQRHAFDLFRAASTAALSNPSSTHKSHLLEVKVLTNVSSQQSLQKPSLVTRFSSIAQQYHYPDVHQKPTLSLANHPPIPDYLQNYYWWAYISPTMIRTLDHQFLVDIVLWGNFSKLRDVAVDALQSEDRLISGKTLQMSCVYANLTEAVVDRLGPEASLDVIDVVPAQLENLCRKLQHCTSSKLDQVALSCYNANDLSDFQDESFDQVLLFFLLHETPDDVRQQVLAEACRVLKPNGGKLVLIDYHKPSSILWQGIMSTMYRIYEPFAKDLWMRDLSSWMPESIKSIQKGTYFGGLYQRVVATK
jgi:ubiquinone/menaquinone biosynthesis C-methylase UbiE